jgi:hypothetical protein
MTLISILLELLAHQLGTTAGKIAIDSSIATKGTMLQ